MNFFWIFLYFLSTVSTEETETPVDLVNGFIGTLISPRTTVPTHSIVHYPNGLVRLRSDREDYATVLIPGISLGFLNPNEQSLFLLKPRSNGIHVTRGGNYTYDNEIVTPYKYSLYLDQQQIDVTMVPSSRSGICTLEFELEGPHEISIFAKSGSFSIVDGAVTGHSSGSQKMHIYLETEEKPVTSHASGSTATLTFAKEVKRVSLRWGLSLVSSDAAKASLHTEIPDYNITAVETKTRAAWNEALGNVTVSGGALKDRRLFYTCLYRTYDDLVDIKEHTNHFNTIDGLVHTHADTNTPLLISLPDENIRVRRLKTNSVAYEESMDSSDYTWQLHSLRAFLLPSLHASLVSSTCTLLHEAHAALAHAENAEQIAESNTNSSNSGIINTNSDEDTDYTNNTVSADTLRAHIAEEMRMSGGSWA